MEFEIVPFEKHLGTKIELPEDLEQQLIEKFGERKFTTTVKDLIRQCIRQNLKETPTKRITVGVTYAWFKRTLEIADRNIGMQEGSEKHRKMYKDGKLALQALIEHLEKKRS